MSLDKSEMKRNIMQIGVGVIRIGLLFVLFSDELDMTAVPNLEKRPDNSGGHSERKDSSYSHR